MGGAHVGVFLEELGELEVTMTKKHCIYVWNCQKINKIFYKCKAFRRNLVML